ncbi:MAG: GNAT family N-acetyltransferase [Woeseiaceae bacterium]|nr:GNAT family N-acetyltransferase [Woeseiaceae bacterium]
MADTRHVRRFRTGDEETLHRLFFETIREVNRKDYTEEQVRAWAPEDYDAGRWSARIRSLNPFICEIDGEIAGYADLQPSGYIDHFFVSRRFQRQGVGSILFDQIEREARATGLEILSADVSITAKPFFEHFGFKVVERQRVTMNGVALDNFRMTRVLS